MKIAICDDEEIYCRKTREICVKYLEERNLESDILIFPDGNSLMDYKGEIHILLLDIDMKELDGITIKELLEEKKRDTIIIFVTSHVELMQEAFGKKVYSFLIKPIDINRFYKVMDRIMEDFNDNFVVELDGSINDRYLNMKSIIYIKAEDKYTNVITMDKKYLVRKSMNEWENLLVNHDFYRIHKSYIINMAYVKKIGEAVVLDDGTKMNLSRNKIKDFKETYFNYIKRKHAM